MMGNYLYVAESERDYILNNYEGVAFSAPIN